MNNEQLLKKYMQKVWNEKDFDSIKDYVANEYTIYDDSYDLMARKNLK